MLRNYLTIALRNLRKHKGYTFINVAGLAVGMACGLLILLYVRHELSYDRHHEKADRVYRLTAAYPAQGRHWAPIGPPVGPAVRDAIPEVEEVVRFYPVGNRAVLRYEDRQFVEPGGLYADSTVFEVFTLPLARGNPAAALSRPGTVVVSEELARRFFGEADPLGRVLQLSGGPDLTITGVMEDVPPATHLPFEFLVSMATFYAEQNDDWLDHARTWAGFYTYVLLRDAAAFETVRRKLPVFVASFFEDEFDGAPAQEVLQLALQPLPEIHLHSKLEKEYLPNGNVTYVYVFSTVALLVLLIACVNFINLVTARGAQRLREVGVRKALGAGRAELIRQFLGESALLVLMALLLAGVLIELSLPLFNQLSNKDLALAEFARPRLLLSALAVLVFTVLASGSYPALVLSSFRPVDALRGRSGSSRWSARLRKGLVVFQFAISVFLISSTLIVSGQLRYVRDKELGFARDNVAVVHLGAEQAEAVWAGLESVKQELQRHPAVREVSLASDYPGDRYSLESVQVEGWQDDEEVQMRIAWGVDHDYLAALGIGLSAGRGFSRTAPADTNAWIISEAAARRLGLDAPVGRVLRWNEYAGPIVGVAKDFHFASLHSAVEPLVIPLRPGVGNYLLVRIEAGRAQEALDFMRTTFDRLAPGQLFRYTFLEDDLAALYATEERLGAVFMAFAGLAILIACLGLFGLAAFAAEQRTKEIGVRKVLGASVPGIVALLSEDFLKLVLIAVVIAAPIAYIGMSRWLEDFAYRIEIGPGVFLLAGAAAVLIALVTVSYQSVKAALADPVKSLRYE